MYQIWNELNRLGRSFNDASSELNCERQKITWQTRPSPRAACVICDSIARTPAVCGPPLARGAPPHRADKLTTQPITRFPYGCCGYQLPRQSGSLPVSESRACRVLGNPVQHSGMYLFGETTKRHFRPSAVDHWWGRHADIVFTY